jgi:hypothetical protein
MESINLSILLLPVGYMATCAGAGPYGFAPPRIVSYVSLWVEQGELGQPLGPQASPHVSGYHFYPGFPALPVEVVLPPVPYVRSTSKGHLPPSIGRVAQPFLKSYVRSPIFWVSTVKLGTLVIEFRWMTFYKRRECVYHTL